MKRKLDIIDITKWWSLTIISINTVICILLSMFINMNSASIFSLCMGICWYVGYIFINKELDKNNSIDKSEFVHTDVSIGFWFFILPSQILSLIFVYPINPLIHWLLTMISYYVGYFIIDKYFDK